MIPRVLKWGTALALALVVVVSIYWFYLYRQVRSQAVLDEAHPLRRPQNAITSQTSAAHVSISLLVRVNTQEPRERPYDARCFVKNSSVSASARSASGFE